MSGDARLRGHLLRSMGGAALLLMTVVPLSLMANGDGSGGAFYVNDFEQPGDDTPARGWNPFGVGTIHRTPSFYASPSNYASRIPSAHGRFHARLRTTGCTAPGNCTGPFTSWGTVSAPATFRPYVTEIDIFLDVRWTMAPKIDHRFDWSSAINNTTGGFHRDFVFNAGTDAILTDGFQPGFFINASTNATRGSSFPQNPCPNPPNLDGPPCRTPVHITTSGWYTFRHHFRNDGGILAVDMTISRHNTIVKTWTIKVPADVITLIGDDRYGWFVINEINDLAADCSVKRRPGGRHPSLFARCSFDDDDEDSDDDDFDSDGKHDDEDSDDDSDGRGDDEDSDDDNDGDRDEEDSDDDNDGIKDRHDSESHRERQRTGGGELHPGEQHTYDFTADANSLMLTADADVLSQAGGLLANPLGLLTQPLLVELVDPNGNVTASSALIAGLPMVSVVPSIPGLYQVRIRNRGTQVVTYESFRIVREAWVR